MDKKKKNYFVDVRDLTGQILICERSQRAFFFNFFNIFPLFDLLKAQISVIQIDFMNFIISFIHPPSRSEPATFVFVFYCSEMFVLIGLCDVRLIWSSNKFCRTEPLMRNVLIRHWKNFRAKGRENDVSAVRFALSRPAISMRTWGHESEIIEEFWHRKICLFSAVPASAIRRNHPASTHSLLPRWKLASDTMQWKQRYSVVKA